MMVGGECETNFVGVDVVQSQRAMVVCYGWGGRATTNFGGVDVVPLLGIVVCHCSVL